MRDQRKRFLQTGRDESIHTWALCDVPNRSSGRCMWMLEAVVYRCER